MNINFSNFKKVEESDKHAVLEHPSGHKLKIAKKGLSDQLRKQLEELPTNLAKGGYAKYAQKFDPNMASKASKPSKPDNTMPGSQSEAKNTFTEPDDMGTDIPKAQLKQELNDKHYPDVVVSALNKKAPPFGPLGAESKQHYPPCINPSCKSFGKSHPNCRCYGGGGGGGSVGEAGYFAEGGEVSDEYYCDANRMHRKGCEYFKDGGDVESDSDKLEKAAQEINAGQVDSGPMESTQPEQPQAPIVNAEMQNNNTPEPEPSEPLETQDDSAGSAPTPREPDSTEMPPAEVFQKYKADHMNQLLNESGAFQNELNNGTITPQHYFHLFGRDDTLGKIGTAFGLMLSGIGSGLTHQPNAALQIMQNEISNDLDAQQKSEMNKQNLLRINQQGLLNQAQEAQMSQETKAKAYALTRMQMNYAALHNLVQNAAKLPPGSPQRQQADAQLAMLNQGVQNENFNIADRAATAAALGTYLNGGQGAGQNTTMMKSGLLGPEAKEAGADIESKTIPGIGQAKLPVPQHVRDQVQAMKTLSDKAADLMQYAGKNFATLSPAKRSIAQQKASEMVNFYNNSIQGGVLTEGRLGWLDDQIKKNPTGIVTQLMGNQQRLNEIKQSNDHRMNLMLQQYGVPVKEHKGQDQIKIVNGVKYKRGPNGEAIKVP